MATVPTRPVAEQSARPLNQQKLQVTARPQAFGSGIGRAVSGIGEALSEAGSVAEGLEIANAKAEATEALVGFRDSLRDTLRDPQEGALAQTGANARGVTDSVGERIRKMRGEFTKDLSPRARQLFEQGARKSEESAKEAVSKHELDQVRASLNNSAEAEVQGLAEDAVNFITTDPAQAEAITQEAVGVALENANLNGLTAEQKQAAKDDLVESITLRQTALIAQDDPVAAKEFFDANKDRISPKARVKLREELDPVVLQERAQRKITDAIGLAGTRTDSNGVQLDSRGVPLFVSGLESNGNTRAENALSSAAGSVQFTEGTYLGLVEELRAEGKVPWAEGLTNDEILETRFDPEKEAQVYKRFRSQNQQALRSSGFEVTPFTEYVAHHFGSGGAAALLGARGDPEQLKMSTREWFNQRGNPQAFEQNPYLQDKTVGGLLRTIKQRVGRQLGDVPAGAVAVANESDPDLRRAMLAELQRVDKTRRDLAALQQNDAERRALEAVRSGTSINDLPADIRFQLGQEGLNTLASAQTAAQNGTVVPDPERELQLRQLLNNDPQKFLDSFSPLDDRLNLDPRVFEGLFEAQQDLQSRRNEDGTFTPANADAANVGGFVKPTEFNRLESDAVDRFEAFFEPDPSADEGEDVQRARAEVRFRDRFLDSVSAFAQRNNRAPAPEEAAEIADTLLLDSSIESGEIQIRGRARQSTSLASNASNEDGQPFFEVAGLPSVELEATLDDIPPGERTRITAALGSSIGRTPTNEEVVEVFESRRLLRAGLLPNIQYGEIPIEARGRIESSLGSRGLTKDEVVRIYLDTVLSALAGGARSGEAVR